MFSVSAARKVHEHLIKTGATLSVAESLTAGNLQAMIAQHSGASKYFKGGVTAYTIPMKAKLLGVDEAAAEACDAVSPQVASEMARGVCALYASDFGIATTGYAGPYPEQGIKEPFAYIAIAKLGSDDLLFEGKFTGRGLKRKRMQIETAKFALARLSEVLALS